MPGAKESSTVEWQRAHWMPTDVIWPLWSKCAGDADHRVELQQREGGRRIVEVDLARA